MAANKISPLKSMPGEKNAKADALSRSFVFSPREEAKLVSIVPKEVIVAALTPDLFSSLSKAQAMQMNNDSMVSEIFLLGFQHLNDFKFPMFSLILLIHILTIYGNVLVIALVTISHGLQSPMFFFIRQLSLSDLLESMVIVPILLKTVMNEGTKISLIGCIAQLYFFGISEVLQCFLLTVMSYDRYLAICNPLRYSSLMNHKFCVKLIVMSWVISFSVTPVVVISATTQKFCNQNTINHFFCDYFPLLELSCSDTSMARILQITMSMPVILTPLILIIVSYMCIGHEILKIVSNTGRQKAFSTCSSHLAVVSIFYGTLIAIYVVPPRKDSQTISKVLSLLYTVVTPFINPMIYSLKSADMKNALKILYNKENFVKFKAKS
ncbi:olfactory receptor 1496-like [Xenopus laevis]|uniref:Olfactory receptor 1496-like n=1 Tax=Xenopus laevis TaxID=8355 RepID=A0A8J1MPQ0_XENLA|nr:olfactory receptor 1496-like [Xenopus laevis]